MRDKANSPPALDKTVVSEVPLAGGLHCETTALGVLLSHASFTLSEPMLFGLGSGLSFIYWDSKKQELPFLGGRVRPFLLTENVSRQLGLSLSVQETMSAKKAWEKLQAFIDAGLPVGLQLDSHDLEYFKPRVHFAGHFVAMYGYDDQRAYLIDTAQQGGAVSTSLESLARARAAKGPMSARHRCFTVQKPTEPTLTREDLVEASIHAIIDCATAFLSPPISNLGNAGIQKAASRIRTWFDRIQDPNQGLAVIAMMMEGAGTGGALFRNLYRDFLTECAGLLDGDRREAIVAEGEDLFAESALLWTGVAEAIDRAGATGSPEQLNEASQLLERIAVIETSAMTVLSSLGTLSPTTASKK